MSEKTLHEAFIDELRDLYDAEKQITKALPKMAKTASSRDLQESFNAHFAETQYQIARLEQVFQLFDEKPRGKHCEGVGGILEEGKAIMDGDFDDPTMDACLVGAAQRVEHYEIAAYGTLVAWASAMGHDEAAALLQESLNEERTADETLSDLSNGINAAAAAVAHSEGMAPMAGADADDDASTTRRTRR
jgi:ferritin-like metal-binding protein YciE